jgi:phage-related protein
MAGPIKISVLADARVASKNVAKFADDTEKSVKEAADSLDRGGKDMVGSIAGRMKSLGSAVMPVLGAVAVAGGAALGAGIGAAAVAAIPLALGGGVLAAGIMAAAKDPKVAKAFEPLKAHGAAVMKRFAEPFKGPLIRAAGTFNVALSKATPFLVEMGKAVAPLIDKLAPALADMALKALPGIVSGVKASIPMISAFVSVLPTVGHWISVFVAGIVALLPYAKQVGLVLLGVGKWIADILIPPLRKIATEYFVKLREGIVQVQAAFKANEPQLRTFLAWVTTAAKWVGEKLVPVIGFILSNAIRVGVTAVKLIIAAISGIVTWAPRAVAKIGELIAWVRAMPGRIRGAVGDLGGLLRDAGRRVIQGFLDGITGAFGAVRSTLSRLTGMLPSWKGPAARDRKLLVGNGKLVMGGFLAGLESQYGGIQSSLGGFTGGLSASASVGGTVSVNTAGAPGWAQELLRVLREPTRLEIRSDGGSVGDLLLELLRERVQAKGGKATVLGVTR